MKYFKRAQKLGFLIPELSKNVNLYENTFCKILNGKLLSNNLIEQAQKICIGKKKPCLAVILAGEDPASKVYVNQKIKAFNDAGFESQCYFFTNSDATEENIYNVILKLNSDNNVDGILVQLPLPKNLNAQKIINFISPKKDVDGFLAHNIGNLALGNFNGSIACTPFGIMTLLYAYGINPSGKHTVVVGRSNIVGKPMGLLLLSADATVTIAHSKTKNLLEICKMADILIVASGQPEMITKDYIKQNAVIIDVGIHRKNDGKLCGDVHHNVKEIASALSPVPGGVGPMTIALLMINVAIAAWEQN